MVASDPNDPRSPALRECSGVVGGGHQNHGISDSADDLKELYANLLKQQQLRADHADRFLRGGTSIINLELAALQLRLMLELIPLGGLVAHRDWVAPVASAFARKKPGEARELVERVNPEWWPRAGEPILTSGVPGFRGLKDGFLQKDEWRAEWRFASSLLHARNPFTGEPDEAEAHARLTRLHARLLTLLGFHALLLPDQNIAWLGVLRDGGGDAAVISLHRAP